MGVERNKRNARRIFEEAFGLGRLEVVDECVAADAVDRHDFAEDQPDFPAHLKGVISMFRAAIPDLAMDVVDLIGEGDRVAGPRGQSRPPPPPPPRGGMTGTHTGAPLFGVTAAGAAVRVEQFHVVQCDDAGRGVAHWAAVGERELVAQLAATALTRA
jgi:predicted ester cyclase